MAYQQHQLSPVQRLLPSAKKVAGGVKGRLCMTLQEGATTNDILTGILQVRFPLLPMLPANIGAVELLFCCAFPRSCGHLMAARRLSLFSLQEPSMTRCRHELPPAHVALRGAPVSCSNPPKQLAQNDWWTALFRPDSCQCTAAILNAASLKHFHLKWHGCVYAGCVFQANCCKALQCWPVG